MGYLKIIPKVRLKLQLYCHFKQVYISSLLSSVKYFKGKWSGLRSHETVLNNIT